MLVKYNGIQLPDLPADLSVEEYPYIFIRKSESTGYYDLACGTQKYYYSVSSSGYSSLGLNIDSEPQKCYRVAINTAFDDNTEWKFNKTIPGDEHWTMDSSRFLIWSLFDIPSGSLTSTTVYYAGTEIEYPAIKKYLVRDNDTIYTVTDGSLVEVSGELNSNLFINDGVDDIPNGTLLMTLSNPEVLCWTDSDTAPTLTATVKGIPEPQVIVSEEINLMDGSIKDIESVTIDCKGEPVFAVSFDKKATWIMHNGTDWVEVTDDVTGMTKAVFEAITTEQWQPKYELSSDMYIRCTLLDETQSLTSITLNFIN